MHGSNELAPDKGASMAYTSAALCICPKCLHVNTVHVVCAGTPFWKLVLKQFDDLLVKAGP